MKNTLNPMPELAALLKQLRLSGVLDSLATSDFDVARKYKV